MVGFLFEREWVSIYDVNLSIYGVNSKRYHSYVTIVWVEGFLTDVMLKGIQNFRLQ